MTKAQNGIIWTCKYCGLRTCSIGHYTPSDATAVSCEYCGLPDTITEIDGQAAADGKGD
jgi:hypothetical protein